MEHTCNVQCWVWALGWLLLATAFVKLAWNHVVAQIWKLKTLRYWQVLLAIVAVVMLCVPRMAMKKHGECCKGGQCDQALTKK